MEREEKSDAANYQLGAVLKLAADCTEFKRKLCCQELHPFAK